MGPVELLEGHGAVLVLEAEDEVAAGLVSQVGEAVLVVGPVGRRVRAAGPTDGGHLVVVDQAPVEAAASVGVDAPVVGDLAVEELDHLGSLHADLLD